MRERTKTKPVAGRAAKNDSRPPLVLLPPDQAARDAAVTDFSRPILVEAAAGTGKTRSLTDRILHILRNGMAEMTQIVAITFTEKAAGEMKEKLRVQLEAALHNQQKPCAREQRERFAAAIKQLEQAQVNTIHAFCAWLLRQRPVEAGVDPGFEVADDLKSELLQGEVWDEWFVAEASREPPPEVLQRALYHGIGPSELRGLATALCANRGRIQGAAAMTHTRPDARAALGEVRRLLAEIEPLAAGGPKGNKIANELERITRALAGAESLDTLALEKVLLRELSFERGSGSKWESTEAFQRAAELAARIDAIGRELADSLLREIMRWLRGYLNAYEARKQREALLDFDDLLLKACQLLRCSPRVRQHFKERFKFILVDEFQDTDPAQTETILWLAEETAAPSTQTDWRKIRLEPGKLFVVGDPQQSIFRFRRADIETYEEAKRVICQDAGPVTLQVNFRSVAGITRWVNRVFSSWIKKPADGTYQPDYVPLIAYRTQDDTPARRVWLVPPTEAEQREITSGASADRVRELEACALAQCLKAMHGKQMVSCGSSRRPAQWCDMAVLFRSFNELPIYERALEQFGIPYQVEGGKDYFQRPEVRTICSLLLCLDNPMDTRELVSTLRSPLFGIPDEEIFLWKQYLGRPLNYLQLVSHDAGRELDYSWRLERALYCLWKLHLVRNKTSFSGFLEHVYRELHVVELYSLMSRGEQRVANLWKLVEFARAAQSAGMMTLRELAQYIRRVALDLSEERQSPATESDDDVVHIITMHKAKGLEWPIVALADLGRGKRTTTDYLLVVRESGRAEARVGGLKTAGFDAAHKAEENRREAEEVRLLYVAATRARDWLVLPWFERRRASFFLNLLKNDCSPANLSREDPLVEQVNRATIAPRRLQVRPVWVKLDKPRTSERAKIAGLVAARAQWLEQRMPWLNSVSEGRPRRRPSAREDEELAEAVGDGGWGRSVGILVHEILGVLDLRAPASEQIRAATALIEASSLPEAARCRAAALAQTAIKSELWRRLGRCDVVRREVPFCCQLGSEMVEGFMDLVFCENAQWHLADYKTDLITIEELPARVELYRRQVETYATAFHQITGLVPVGKHLFFLELDRVVEV